MSSGRRQYKEAAGVTQKDGRGDRVTLKELPVGSIITDKRTRFNNNPIKWLVADHTMYADGTVLLSKDILCCRPFDKAKEYYEDEYRRRFGSNRWRDSDIREWLNEFFNGSFSDRLADLTIYTLRATEVPECDRDSSMKYFKDGTGEPVFLVSDTEIGCEEDYEALELFRGENKEKYLMAEVCPGLTWYWWLRSPYAGNSCHARNVYADGSLNNNNAYNGNPGVRPACVISSSAPVKKRKNGEYKFNWKR